MKCKDCDNEATRACTRCGRFYCPQHGGSTFAFEGVVCNECFHARRPVAIIGAVVFFALGVALLFGTALAGVVFLAAAALLALIALRRLPL
jgi:hypothetical protein